MRQLFFRALTVVTLMVAATIQTIAQNGFAYQAVIRDSEGNLITNQKVGLRFRLLYADSVCYAETQDAVTNQYGNISVVIGNVTKPESGSFAGVPWNTLDITLKVEVKPEGTKDFKLLGQTKINPAPYAMYAAQGGGAATVSGATKDGDPLFQVNDRNGNPVFAVTPDGIVIYVDDSDSNEKVRRSGFFITGRESTKGGAAQEYFSVTPDGTQVYVDADGGDKVRRSGFYITGRESKGGESDYLTVDGDGTKVYVDATNDDKVRRSGFLIVGRTAAKDDEADIFAVDGNLTKIYVDDDESKVRRSGFLIVGRNSKSDPANEKYMAVTSDRTDLSTSAFTVTEHNSELGTVQSMISVNTSDDGQAQVKVHTDIAMEDEVIEVVDAPMQGEYTMVVNDSMWFIPAKVDDYNYDPEYNQLMAIYGEGEYAPAVSVEIGNGNNSMTIPSLFFDGEGNPTSNAKKAAVVVFDCPDEEAYVIRPFVPMDNKTIEFGLMNTDGEFVKITAKINSKNGVPFGVPVGDFEGGKIINAGGLYFGTTIKLVAIPDDGKIFVGWETKFTIDIDNNNYEYPSFIREYPLNGLPLIDEKWFGSEDSQLPPFFTDPVLYVSHNKSSRYNHGFSVDWPIKSIDQAVQKIAQYVSAHFVDNNLDWTINVVDSVYGVQNIPESITVVTQTPDQSGTEEEIAIKDIVKSIRLTGSIEDAKIDGSWWYSEDSGWHYGAGVGAGDSPMPALTVMTQAPVIIDNLTITRGYANNGGGIYVGNGADVTVDDVVITGNVASNFGGGVYVSGKFNMDGGSINGNTANWGGGVLATATSGAEFTMTDGEISGNSATKGSGLYLATCTFTMSKDARINANNDVYLAGAQNIKIGGTFSGTDIVATITPTNYTTAIGNPVLGGEAELVESECGRFAVTPYTYDNGIKYYRVMEDGKLLEMIGNKSVPDAVGDIVFTDGTAVAYSSDLRLTPGQMNSAVAVIFDAEHKKGVALWQSSDVTRWCANDQLDGYKDVPGACDQYNGLGNTNAIYQLSDFEMNSGNYPPFEYAKGYTAGGYTDWYIPAIYELEDIYSKKDILNAVLLEIGGTKFIDTGNSSTNTYYWSSSQDWQGGANANYAYAVRFRDYAVTSTTKVGNSSYQTICYSRCIRQFGGNNDNNKLATYYVAPDATTVNGGIGNDSNNGLSGNTPFATVGKAISMMTEAKDYLVVVCGCVKGSQTIENIPEGSTLIIMGNRNNETDALDANGSGAVLEVKTSVPITIKNLKITNGGASGIKMEGGADVTLGVGALVNSNDAGQDGLGGGVYIAGGKLTMFSGSEVSSNTANVSGGGIHIEAGATLDMKDGIIQTNQAGYFGKSVYVGGTFNMSGGKIKYNPNYSNGGDVRVDKRAVFNIQGSAIIDNDDYVSLDSYSNEYATINIAGQLEGEGRVAVIEPLNYDENIPLLTSSVPDYLPVDRFAVAMHDGYVWNITSDGKSEGDFTKGKGTMKSIKGKFSVSDDKKVQFSSGNLKYFTAQPKRWEFAANQYDALRDDNIVYPKPFYDASFNDSIDLFGYGTSDYNGKEPTLNLTSDGYYYSGNINETEYDWGVKITNDYNTTEQWRTLTKSEWTYLLSARTNADQLYGLATVVEVNGIIILPDNWSSDGTPGFTAKRSSYTDNTYNSEQWSQMEEKGAVFLPVTGYRNEMSVSNQYIYDGYYWTSTAGSSLHFSSSSIAMDNSNRSNGYAVRLVHDYDDSFIGTKAPGSKLEVGDIVFSDGSATTYTEGLTLDENQKAAAIAVIFYVGTEGDALGNRTLGIGKYNSTSDGANTVYDWAVSGAMGSNPSQMQAFNDILSHLVYEEPASGQYASFNGEYLTGDLDGSDNWGKVKEIDKNYMGKYPGFEWVDGYADSYNLPENYKDGWFMPSAAELYTLWMNLFGYDKNKLINSILTAIGGTTLKDQDDDYVYSYLTSNRTYENEDGYEYISLTIGFDEGATCSQGLYTVTGYVCAIREF